MVESKVIFGMPEEWDEFKKTYKIFLEKLPKLDLIIDKVFIRTFDSRQQADGVVYHLGRLCVEDFNEILVLCGNGYGIGGLKLLRGLYERVVTMAYIKMNPSEAVTFLGYHPIYQGKALHHAEQIIDVTKILQKTEIEEIEKQYKETKDKYKGIPCPKCGFTSTRMSWSLLDIGSMAKKVDLEGYYATSYFDPTMHGHATPASILMHIEAKEGGDAIFDESAQKEKVAQVLNQAHGLMVYTLHSQNEFFNLGMDEELKTCLDDYIEAWEHIPVVVRTVF